MISTIVWPALLPALAPVLIVNVPTPFSLGTAVVLPNAPIAVSLTVAAYPCVSEPFSVDTVTFKSSP